MHKLKSDLIVDGTKLPNEIIETICDKGLSFSNCEKLKSIIGSEYEIDIDTITLLNDWCASVYLLCTSENKYIFKLYRNFDTEIAMQSVNIMEFLAKQSFPVATIINTKNDYPTVLLPFSEGGRVGVLFEHIDGTLCCELDFKEYAAEIGETVGLMHTLMDGYDKPLARNGKEFYIGRALDIMKKYGYSPAKIKELSDYSDSLWNVVSTTRKGFCHGDLNPSNFIKAKDGKIYLFDFDCAGVSYFINDIFMICSSTESMPRINFATLENPMERLMLMKKGYEKYFKLNDFDAKAMYAFFGVNCFWMIAQAYIYKSFFEGRDYLTESYFNEHYEWLMQWESQYKIYFGS